MRCSFWILILLSLSPTLAKQGALAVAFAPFLSILLSLYFGIPLFKVCFVWALLWSIFTDMKWCPSNLKSSKSKDNMYILHICCCLNSSAVLRNLKYLRVEMPIWSTFNPDSKYKGFRFPPRRGKPELMVRDSFCWMIEVRSICQMSLRRYCNLW